MTVGILLRKKNLILPQRYGAFTGKLSCRISDLKAKKLFPANIVFSLIAVSGLTAFFFFSAVRYVFCKRIVAVAENAVKLWFGAKQQ